MLLFDSGEKVRVSQSGLLLRSAQRLISRTTMLRMTVRRMLRRMEARMGMTRRKLPDWMRMVPGRESRLRKRPRKITRMPLMSSTLPMTTRIFPNWANIGVLLLPIFSYSNRKAVPNGINPHQIKLQARKPLLLCYG